MEHPTTCPACNAKVVSYEGYTTTLLGFREPPPPHKHDPNCFVHMYICENGHQISQREVRSCPECQWKQPETCSCHPTSFRVYDPATDSFPFGGDPRKPLKDLVTTYAPGS